MYIRKQINRSKRYFNYDENTTLNKVNKTVKNSIYKNYSISNIQENFLSNKSVIHNNITRKVLPIFIQEDHYFYFNKTVNGSTNTPIINNNNITRKTYQEDNNLYFNKTVDLTKYYNKSYIDDYMASFQNLMTIFDQRLTSIQASINPSAGNQY